MKARKILVSVAALALVAAISIGGTLVHYKNVVGTPVFTIPYLGYFSNWITHAPGKYIAITAAVVFLILLFLPDMLKKADEADQRAAERKREKER